MRASTPMISSPSIYVLTYVLVWENLYIPDLLHVQLLEIEPENSGLKINTRIGFFDFFPHKGFHI